MNTIKIVAQERKGLGKELTNKVRLEGKMPAVIYGKNQESISISLDYNEMYKSLFKGMGRNNLYTITLDKKSYDVIPYDLQIHPLSREVQHIDFKMVKENEKVKIKVPIKQTGVSVGVKKGGKLDQKLPSITLKLLPNDICKEIFVDVTGLDQEQQLLVKDLKLPASAEVLKVASNAPVIIVSASGDVKTEEQPEKEKVAAKAAPKAEAKADPKKSSK